MIDTASPTRATLSPSEKVDLYRQMLIVRRTEEQLARAHAQGLVHGACHTYVGEEAIAVGVCANLRADDSVFSTHRGHGHALAKGVPPRELIAELLGRAGGCSHGRGGSMHVFSPEVGMLGTSGIVGPSLLMATGVAYAFRLAKSDRVSVAFFGDGASNNGAFHEALNMASIWKLPVLFVCENNQYATEVPFASVAGNADVGARGNAYGMPSVNLDGNDVEAVFEAARSAVDRARAGGGPTLLSCTTYRTRAHSEGMRDAGYRTREEVEAWRARDPLKRLAESLGPDAVEPVEREIQALVDDALEWAKASPYPDPASVLDHVYDESAHA